jgi:hypothetical protein
MNFIIDTHILLWFIEGDKRVGDENVKQTSNPQSFCLD